MSNSRSRSFDGRGGIIGTRITFPPFPSTVVESQLQGDWGTCDDSVAARREKRVDNALLIVRKSTRLPIFNGTYPLVGTPIKQLINCPSEYNPAPPSPSSVFPPLTTVQQSSLAWEALAATNPNVSHVSLPSYWAELKDLPSLWRDWGNNWLNKANWNRRLDQVIGTTRNSISDAARAYLTWRWAIKPMLSDIWAMWTFQEDVIKRLKWLSALQSGKRVLKRKASIRNNTSVDAPTTVQLRSNGAFIQGRRTVSYFEKVWTTVRWKLDSSVPLIPGVGLEFDPLWIKAHQLTFGVTSREALHALWQIMPWSWFVDWFLHVSTVMDATNNTIPMVWDTPCIMRHTKGIALVQPLSSSADLAWCRISGTHVQSEDRKQRLVVGPVLPFAPSFMPVFTTGQWSILGSLAVLRSGLHIGSKNR